MPKKGKGKASAGKSQRSSSARESKSSKPSRTAGESDLSSIRKLLEGQAGESQRLKRLQENKQREKEDRRAGLRREIDRVNAVRQPTDSDQPSPAEQNRLDAMDKLARGLALEKRTSERTATKQAVRRQKGEGLKKSFDKKQKETAAEQRLSAMDKMATKLRTERLEEEEKSTREALVRQAKEAEKSRREAEREADKSKPFKYLTDVEKLLRKRGIEKYPSGQYTSKDFTVTDFDNKNVSRVNPATAHLPSGHSSNRRAHSHSAVSHFAATVSRGEPEPQAQSAADRERVFQLQQQEEFLKEVAKNKAAGARGGARALEPEQSSFPLAGAPARTVRGAGGAAPAAGRSLSDIFGDIDRGAR